jgi:hypothetical protein
MNLFTLHISVNHPNPCKKLKKKEELFFQDLELLIDPCLVGSKYINVPKFEGENSLTSLRPPFSISTRRNEDLEKATKMKRSLMLKKLCT